MSAKQDRIQRLIRNAREIQNFLRLQNIRDIPITIYAEDWGFLDTENQLVKCGQSTYLDGTILAIKGPKKRKLSKKRPPEMAIITETREPL